VNRQQAARSTQQAADRPQVWCILFCLLAAACKREPWVPKAPPKPTPAQVRQAHIDQGADDSSERQNLLNTARGAAVVDRTAEYMLDNGAVRAIDGDPSSDWISPLGDPLQTLTFSFAAKSRIEKLGISSPPIYGVKTVTFETSLDGTHFTRAAQHVFERRKGEQLFDVTPADALYLRVTVDDTYAGTANLLSIIARGKELEPVAPRNISGCWAVNTFPAAFDEHGGTASGWFDQGERMWIEGGFDGRVWRFVWIRGPQYGLLAVTMPPGSERLSAQKWYIDGDPYNQAENLFGERRPCGAPDTAPRADVLRTYLDRHGYVPIYGLHFDASNALDAAASDFALSEILRLIAATTPRPVTLISRELRGADAAADRSTAQQRLDSLKAELTRRKADLSRVRFTARGRDDFRTAVWSEMERTLQSGIEIEIPLPR